MKSSCMTAVMVLCLALPVPISAQEVDSSIAVCLKAWGNHPFGKNPHFKTMQTSVKVFGIGKKAGDTEPTLSPSLVLVNRGVNILGGSTIELLNPHGWYCLRSTVNVVAGMTIRAHCKAHLASASDGTTLGDSEVKDQSATPIGAVSVERVDCS